MQNPTDGDSYHRLETPQTRHLPRGAQGPPWPDIIKSIKRLIADPKVPAKARISRQKCHLRQNSVNCEMS